MQSGWETITDLEWADAFARYIAGESSPEERATVRAWAAGLSGKVNAADAFAEVWKDNPGLDAAQVTATWDTIIQRIGAEDTGAVSPVTAGDTSVLKRHSSDSTPRPASAPYRWLAWGIGVVASVGLLTVALRAPNTLGRSSGSTSATSTSYTVHTTQPGQRTSIELTDGTRVLLNVASTLEVSRNFGVSNRIVRLRGQAVFEVEHADAQPFIVDAVGTRTTVLGTTFGVRAYDANVQVAVRDGKVSIAACDAVGADAGCNQQRSRAVITSHEIVTVTPAGQIEKRTNAEIDADFAFTTGRLLLTGKRLGDVVDELNRWYDVEFQLADTVIANKVIEGSFPVGTLDALIQSLTVVLDAHVHRNGRVIVVSALPQTDSVGDQNTRRGSHNTETRTP